MYCSEYSYLGANAILYFCMYYVKITIIVEAFKVNSLESYCNGLCEGMWIRLQVLRFFVNSLVLGYQLGISFEMLENVGSRLFWYISDFIWLLCVCLISQSFCV